MKRRTFIGAALAAAAWPAHAAGQSRSMATDFEVMWQAIDSGYAYFDAASKARWRRVRRLAARPATPAALTALLESALAELRDDHVSVVGVAPRMRRIPYELDVWPRWRAGAASIEAVRTFGDADAAGLQVGQVITRVRGVPIEVAVREQLRGAGANVADIEWALRRVIAGPRAGMQKLEVQGGGRTAAVEVERNAPAESTSPPILGRRMGDERDIGYIRVRVGASDPALASHFAGALGHMSGTRALIVDLRENAGPGARDVSLAILSRFARASSTWQTRQRPGGARVADVVQPEGVAYPSPVAVLTDRWTAGEGEALAAGLVAIAGARMVGTPMAGLRGELHEVVLPVSGLAVRFPGERAFTADGEPRETLQPAVPVDLAAPSGGPGDPILYQALKLFERR